MQLVFASSNKKKTEEIIKLLPKRIELLNLTDVKITEDIAETGDTFKANALIKAQYVYELTGINCFADDSGLEVEALDMRPGVYSARYAGIERNDDANMDKLLKELAGKTIRNARFNTVIALILNGNQHFFEGTVYGRIINEKRGSSGFGYDPVFVADGYDQTFAEISIDEKNKISHRAQAIRKLKGFLESL